MPGAFPSPSPAKKAVAKTDLSQPSGRASIEIPGDGDSDVEILAHTLQDVLIDGKGGLV